MRDLAEQFRATMTLPVLLRGKPAKGNCCSNLSAPVTRFCGNQQFLGRGGRAWRYIVIGIIDKLPFTSPDDPLLKARMEIAVCAVVIRSMKYNCRMRSYSQAGGRAIDSRRRRSRRAGICDNRLVMRPYGATFLASLRQRRAPVTLPVRFVSLRYHPQVICYGVWYDARLFIDLSTKPMRILAIDTATEACSVALWTTVLSTLILSFALVNILNESTDGAGYPDHQRNFPD